MPIVIQYDFWGRLEKLCIRNNSSYSTEYTIFFILMYHHTMSKLFRFRVRSVDKKAITKAIEAGVHAFIVDDADLVPKILELARVECIAPS